MKNSQCEKITMENLEETKKLRKTHYEKLEKTLENLEQLRN